MRKLLFIAAICGAFSCGPQVEQLPVNYMAVVTFPAIQHEMNVYSSMQVGYSDETVEYSIVPHEPAIAGKRYIDTVYLNNVNLAHAVKIQFGVQQGHLPGPVYNLFKADIYLNGSLFWSEWVNGPDSDFDLNLGP